MQQDFKPKFVNIYKKRDPRRFQAVKTFGVSPIENVPNDFIVGQLPKIKNQFQDPICSGMASAYILENKLGKEVSPEYVIQKETAIGGYDPFNFNGVDVDTSHKATYRYGSIDANRSPYKVGKDPLYVYADPDKWDLGLDQLSNDAFRSSFEITKSGYKDLFDAVRATMYSKQVWADCAGWFVSEWIYAQQGIIPKQWNRITENGHKFVFCGSKTIDGEPYLICPNSWGEGVGDKGFYYFPREAVNALIDVSFYTPEDPDDIKQQQWNALIKLYDYLITLLKKLSNKLQAWRISSQY